MKTTNLTKTDNHATITPRLAVARRTADQWADIAGKLAELAALITAARPAAGTYRDAASWERDRAAMDKRLEIVSQLERRFASEAARIAEAT